jgi:hypothetical protein
VKARGPGQVDLDRADFSKLLAEGRMLIEDLQVPLRLEPWLTP